MDSSSLIGDQNITGVVVALGGLAVSIGGWFIAFKRYPAEVAKMRSEMRAIDAESGTAQANVWSMQNQEWKRLYDQVCNRVTDLEVQLAQAEERIDKIEAEKKEAESNLYRAVRQLVDQGLTVLNVDQKYLPGGIKSSDKVNG